MSGLIDEVLKLVSKYESEDINFDLDNWIKDFEDGFPKYVKHNQLLNQQFWGQGYTHRPKIWELNYEPDAEEEEGFRVVELYPDREVDESYICFGTPLELQTQIVTLMNIHRMLNTRSIGNFVGYPLDEMLHNKPRQEVGLQFILTSKQEPPFYKTGGNFYTQRQVTVPAVDRRKLTYANLRNACGGDNGQLWGEWSARANVSLSDTLKGSHQIVVGGSTKDNARENLQGFLELTRCEVLKISYHQQDLTVGTVVKDPHKGNYSSFRVYPAWVTAMNSKLIAIDNQRNKGRRVLSGKLMTKQNKLFLYSKKQPIGWLDDLLEVTRSTFD